VTKILSSISLTMIGVFFTPRLLLTNAHYFPKHALFILRMPLIRNSWDKKLCCSYRPCSYL